MDGKLSSIVTRAAGRRVLLVGDLILDQYVYGDAERISPEAPVPVLRIVERSDAVGGSGNVAACLQALGVETVTCGVVGNDAHGKRLKDLLIELGADIAGILTAGDRPTTTKTRLIGLAQHRHRQQLMRVDDESTAPLTETDRAQLVGLALDAVAGVDAICIEDYEKGVVTSELVAALVEAANRADKPVLVDPGRLSDYSRYRGARILTPNRNELALATGQERTRLEDIATDAEELRRACENHAIVVTLDREGALVVAEGHDWQHIPTKPRSVYDNTGAGDAVLAMLTAALVGGAELHEATRLANIAGGLEVEKFGCVPVTAEEVQAELRLEAERRNGKLRSTPDLVAELKLRRDRGETVVFTNGCFDLLHAGHIEFLDRCRDEGSVLVVGINSDQSVRAQCKGEERPIVSERDRAAVLAGLGSVDYVVIFNEPDPGKLIEQIRPDVLVKGEDWAERGVVGRETVESYGGKVKLLPLVSGYSTTHIVNRIIDSAAGTTAS